MRQVETRRLSSWVWAAGLAASLGCGKDPGFRFTAPINVDRPGPFVQLPLPVGAYSRSLQPDLEDLRILDARGERVPFAILAPRMAQTESIEQRRDAVLYPLPATPTAAGWQSPVEVTVQGDRISVKRRERSAAAMTPDRRSGGWLIDLGERERGAPPPTALRMEWSGPAEFSAGFSLETSDDLNRWRGGDGGQLMALASAAGPLTQPTVRLPEDGGRFVRLVWAEPASAPVLVGAKVVAAGQRSVALDPPSELVLSPKPEPADREALHFDLGGRLAVVEIDLRLAPGTRVAPVRLQGRTAGDEPWSELAASVFYRLERGGAEVNTSPPLGLHANIRYVRVVPDARAAALDPAKTELVVRAQLASLVFANQGQAPFTLSVGSRNPASSALPVSTVVPLLDDERPRFGRASLGDWTEVAAVATAFESERKLAALRPWLLWAVLLVGVAGLGFMVWRLARGAGPLK